MLVGTYVNRNYRYSSVLSGIPYVSDGLRLCANNQSENSYWGKGTYKITYTITGSKIDLIYNYQFRKASYKASISRLNLGAPKVILFREKDHYYERID